LDQHLMTPILSGVIFTIISALVGQFIGSADKKKLDTWRIASVFLGVVVFLLLWKLVPPWGMSSNDPVLLGVQAKPNFVHPGDTVTISVQIDRPAPKNGVSIVLNSSDPAILTIDGNAAIEEGQTVGTGYSQVVKVPNYPSPVGIRATLNGAKKQTDVKVVAASTPVPVPVVAHHDQVATRYPQPAPPARDPVVTPPPPPHLSAELLGRFEEAQSQLSSEDNFWKSKKQEMPPGTSLRPEITSEIFAANSAVQRCKRAQEAFDSNSLSSCIDVLNDHLNRLKIQH